MYSTQVSDVFRTYSILLSEGIPSIISLVKGRNRSLITIQNDKSVSTSRSLGDKVVDGLAKQAELKSLFDAVTTTLDAIDSRSRQLLTDYYCENRTISESLQNAGFKSTAAMEYAKALFAYHYPEIRLSEEEFHKICADLAASADAAVQQEIDIRERFSAYKKDILSSPELYFDAADSLESLDADNNNHKYLSDCASGDVKFWRKRNQLLLAMFYSANSESDFNVILDLLKEGQGQKRYMQRLHKTLHPELY